MDFEVSRHQSGYLRTISQQHRNKTRIKYNKYINEYKNKLTLKFTTCFKVAIDSSIATVKAYFVIHLIEILLLLAVLYSSKICHK